MRPGKQMYVCVLDVGYLDNNAYKMLVPTAWVPLLDANETNGCLQVLVFLLF